MKTLMDKLNDEIAKTKAEASIGGDHTVIVAKLSGLRIAKELLGDHVVDNATMIDAQVVVPIETLVEVDE